MLKIINFTLLLVLSAFCLSGCGQYGALYLPSTKQVPTNLQHQKNEEAKISSTIQQGKA
jgi:predicted small lipoprotein YifL